MWVTNEFPNFTLYYQDEHLLVVEKPAGVLSVPGRGQDKQQCLEQGLRLQCGAVWTVHRLDEATSGLMLFARCPHMQAQLQEAFRNRRIHKRYQALCHGRLSAPTGTIDLPLITDWPRRPRQMVSQQTSAYPDSTHPNRLHYAKASVTKWQSLGQASYGGRVWSWLELEPVTGRSHQLRVHMAAIGHPLVGDNLYSIDMAQKGDGTVDRLCLHASELAFVHPIAGQEMQFFSPPPFISQGKA